MDETLIVLCVLCAICCVFSNAHYYLHDDEDVIKLLYALATCSQRMAASRLVEPDGDGAGNQAASSSAPIVPSNPADIPTSPPLVYSSTLSGNNSGSNSYINAEAGTGGMRRSGQFLHMRG